ncbi:MAG: hypothetical protein KKC20_12430, partial [Proteobacteria bacterium]|nr:hypothetical protein [Pseudomonadota bacterium]
ARYSHPLGRIIAQPSLNPVNLVRNGTWITWTAVGVLGFCLCLVLALIRFIRKKFRSDVR